jgi:hypothetical protein
MRNVIVTAENREEKRSSSRVSPAFSTVCDMRNEERPKKSELVELLISCEKIKHKFSCFTSFSERV